MSCLSSNFISAKFPSKSHQEAFNHIHSRQSFYIWNETKIPPMPQNRRGEVSLQAQLAALASVVPCWLAQMWERAGVWSMNCSCAAGPGQGRGEQSQWEHSELPLIVYPWVTQRQRSQLYWLGTEPSQVVLLKQWISHQKQPASSTLASASRNYCFQLLSYLNKYGSSQRMKGFAEPTSAFTNRTQQSILEKSSASLHKHAFGLALKLCWAELMLFDPGRTERGKCTGNMFFLQLYHCSGELTQNPLLMFRWWFGQLTALNQGCRHVAFCREK